MLQRRGQNCPKPVLFIRKQTSSCYWAQYSRLYLRLQNSYVERGTARLSLLKIVSDTSCPKLFSLFTCGMLSEYKIVEIALVLVDLSSN
jgi:hypothetical protein